MQSIRTIDDYVAIAGQIELDQLPQLVQAGYRSVLNVRLPSERGFLEREQQIAEWYGLRYVNLPFESELISNDAATEVLQQIRQLPKPVLVHCDTATRSAAIALMYIATQQDSTLEQAFKQAKQLGLFGVLTQA